MGWNVECVVLLLVFTERWLYLGRGEKMEKVPHHRRECEEHDPGSETCACLNGLQLRNGPQMNISGLEKMRIFAFLEVSNEAFCWLGVK